MPVLEGLYIENYLSDNFVMDIAIHEVGEENECGCEEETKTLCLAGLFIGGSYEIKDLVEDFPHVFVDLERVRKDFNIPLNNNSLYKKTGWI